MPIPALQALKILNDTVITTVTAPNSITPDVHGGITDDLIDIIDPLFETELNREFSGTTTVPSDLDGNDGDVDFYNDGSDEVTVYQKVAGSWVDKGGFLIANRAVTNNTSVELTSAELDVLYPTATVGFEVMCEDITDSPLIYKKGTSVWYSIMLGQIG